MRAIGSSQHFVERDEKVWSPAGLECTMVGFFEACLPRLASVVEFAGSCLL